MTPYTITFSTKYEVGDVIQTYGGERFKIVGYVHVPQRGTQYVCIPGESSNEYKREYFYEFEIEGLKKG